MDTINDCTYEKLPEQFRGGIRRWIEHRMQPGHFLTAVLSNDLFEAYARADINAREQLFDIVAWLYNYAPSPCWGSSEKVQMWLRRNKDVD